MFFCRGVCVNNGISLEFVLMRLNLAFTLDIK